MNPIAYLLIALVGTSAMLSIIFLIAWYSFGRRPYACTWSLAFGVATLQWLLNLASPYLFSNRDHYWLVVGLTQIATVSLALLGHRQRAGLSNRWGWYVAGGGLVEGLVAWFTLVDRHEGLRGGLGTIYAGIVLLLCVQAVFAHPRRDKLAAEWGLALATGTLGLLQILAGLAMLSGGAAPDAESLQLYMKINFLGMPAAYCGMGLFAVLILASDMSAKMRTLALMDALTGVMNRRGFEDAGLRCFSALQRTGSALSVVVCDIDHFKRINDLHGHAVGDRALRRFGRCLRDAIRPSDILGRIGGEEFALLLPAATLAQAQAHAERLRAAVAGICLETRKGTLQLRASFGVATRHDDDADLASLMQRADAALYQAKREGRDRVIATVDSGGSWATAST